MNEPLPIAVFLSGPGSTLKNLIECIERGELNCQIVLVVSSKANVGGLEHARKAGIPTRVFERKSFANLADFKQANFQAVLEAGAELVCLAGYLAKLSIPKAFEKRVLNIHPSLLPKFGGKGMYGMHVHTAVLEAGEKQTGCTVHYVDDEYDHGPVILQKTVPVFPDDTPESLAERVRRQEFLAYPEAIRLWIAGKV